jgi:flavin-binding protein dodecin
MYGTMHLANGKMPEFYQVVVKVVFRARSPVQLEYVTHRVLK